MQTFTQWLRENYGEILFGPERLDVPQPAEPNTPSEDQAWNAFHTHYLGGRDSNLVANLPQIIAAKRQGKYRDFLDVPEHYKFAYRLMADVPVELMKTGFGFDANDSAKAVSGVLSGGTYESSVNRISSWTVDVAVLPKIVKDFGKLYRKHAHSYHVLLLAKLENNRDSFLINPDKYEVAPELAGQFSYQKEIISYAPVELWKIIYCDKNAFNGTDITIVNWLVSQIRNINY